jgi:hypothetical protein
MRSSINYRSSRYYLPCPETWAFSLLLNRRVMVSIALDSMAVRMYISHWHEAKPEIFRSKAVACKQEGQCCPFPGT